MTVLRFGELIKKESDFSTHLANPHGNMKRIAEMLTQLFCQLFCPVGDDVHVFGHPAFVNVRVDGHCPENRGILTPVDKVYNRLLNRSFRQRIVHDNLVESQASVDEHRSPPHLSLVFYTSAELMRNRDFYLTQADSWTLTHCNRSSSRIGASTIFCPCSARRCNAC